MIKNFGYLADTKGAELRGHVYTAEACVPYQIKKETETTFHGFCRDSNLEKDIIDFIRVEDNLECQNRCQDTKECVAYAFERKRINKKNCDLYRKGPYVMGSSNIPNEVTCYVMQEVWKAIPPKNIIVEAEESIQEDGLKCYECNP